MSRDREVKVVVLGEDRGGSKALNSVAAAADNVGPSGKVASNALDSVTSALTSGLGPAAGPAKDALDKVGTSALSSGGMLKTAMAGGAVVAGLALTKFALDGVAGATSLNESLSKSNTIFDEHGAGIEKWASGGARDFGLAKGAALEAAGSFGNLFTQLDFGKGQAADMSTTMVELAADFASFHNADITEVIQAQTAAFRGEYDAVQRFVPTINAAAVEQKALEMGLAATKGELTAQHKAMATYTLLTEGAGKAAGDFDRTSGGLANQQRILKAQIENVQTELGGALIPVLVELGNIVIPLVSGVSSLADKVGGLGNVASTVGKGMLPMLNVLDLLPGKSKKAGEESDKQAQSAAGLAGEMGVLAGETGKAEAKTVDIAKETENARKEAEKYEKKIGEMAAQVGSAYTTMSGKSTDLSDKVRDQAKAYDTDKSSADQLKQGLDILIGTKISATQAAIRWEEAIDNTSQKLSENKATLDITTEAGRENQTVIIGMIQAALGHVDALQREGATSDRVTAAYHDHVGALRNVMHQAGYTESQINDLLGRYNLLAAAPDINKRITTTHEAVYVQRGDRTYGGNSPGIQQFARGIELGPIQGRRGEAVPIIAHAGEWVLTDDQLVALKRRESWIASMSHEERARLSESQGFGEHNISASGGYHAYTNPTTGEQYYAERPNSPGDIRAGGADDSWRMKQAPNGSWYGANATRPWRPGDPPVDSPEWNNMFDPNRGKAGYYQAEDGSWVPDSTPAWPGTDDGAGAGVTINVYVTAGTVVGAGGAAELGHMIAPHVRDELLRYQRRVPALGLS